MAIEHHALAPSQASKPIILFWFKHVEPETDHLLGMPPVLQEYFRLVTSSDPATHSWDTRSTGNLAAAAANNTHTVSSHYMFFPIHIKYRPVQRR